MKAPHNTDVLELTFKNTVTSYKWAGCYIYGSDCICEAKALQRLKDGGEDMLLLLERNVADQ